MTDPNANPEEVTPEEVTPEEGATEEVDTDADGTLVPSGDIDVTFWLEDNDPQRHIGDELTDEQLKSEFPEGDVDFSEEGDPFELSDEDLNDFLDDLSNEASNDIRGASWHLAPSLVRLRAEINLKWPHRDKRSDGSIGDVSHSAGASDHNPNRRRSVNAIDIDKDGVSPLTIVSAAKRHPACNYVIYNRVIYSRAYNFRARHYSGPNPHNHHIHVSIKQTVAAEQSTRGWLGNIPAPKPPVPPAPRAKYALPEWPFGTDHTKYFSPYLHSEPPVYNTIRNVQRKLYSIGYSPGAIDGKYGPATHKAITRFQGNNGLKADGLIGYNTYNKLRNRS